MAWAQVALAQGAHTRQAAWAKPGWLGLGAFACVALLGLACAAALHLGWLSPKWSGVWHYIAPLVVWQGSACVSAAFSHRPFQTQAAQKYSWACMGLATVQGLVLIVPIGISSSIDPTKHMNAFSLVSVIGLTLLTLWKSRLR
jgi:hypothetical protein